MIPLDDLLLFFLTACALGIAPGPDNLFVVTQSALHGRVAGLLVTLGLCTGLIVHTAAVALGVAAVFQTSAWAFDLLKIVGAAYLLYLAWQAMRAGATDMAGSDGGSNEPRALYIRGIVMNLTNPKVAIFFLAFLPQFVRPEAGSLTRQLLLLGAVFIVATLMVFGALAWTAGYLGEWLKQSARAQIVMNRVAGAIFVALAVRLAVTER